MEKSSQNNAYSKPPKPVFIAAAIVFFFLALSAADSIGFVPDYIDGIPAHPAVTDEDNGTSAGEAVALTELPQLGDDMLMLDSEGRLLPPRGTGVAAVNAAAQFPARITIGAIDLDLKIQNPTTKDVDALDALLVNGPARYTDSAKLGEAGNMIIFAHSSHLPVIHNQMYKAFNRVPELVAGDTITLTGEDGTKYLYSVNSVKKVDVNDNVTISLARDGGTKLTLVTCDTLSGKSARFVLDADFIGTAN
ncbi:sortase [Candidatus Kaiserbacteria bacterium]|nr:sortase [Candidatus Kaiserbacteria bacterium]